MTECIGILGAMAEEVNEIKGLMEDCSTEIIGGREYHLGSISGTPVVLTFSRWGKVASASTVTTLIVKYQVSKVIFTGVAGGVSEDLQVGDVVISEKLYQHDMDARPLMPQFVIPLTDRMYFEASAELVELATNASHELLESGEMDEVLEEFRISKPKAVQGVLASGDEFISSKERLLELRRQNDELLAVEMEGAAVAQVCAEHEVPFVIVRVISDKADEEADRDFLSFVAQLASKYTAGIVKGMLNYSCLELSI